MGRVKYSRRTASQLLLAATAGDWKCEILLPEETMPTVMEKWAELWYDQRRKQVTLTDAEYQAMGEAARNGDPTARRYNQ
eukprot:10518071-Lingulodinium_polyedra.AAC.1